MVDLEKMKIGSEMRKQQQERLTLCERILASVMRHLRMYEDAATDEQVNWRTLM